MDIDGDDTAVGSSIGVRLGACDGPILFPFIMQAALETAEYPRPSPPSAAICVPESDPWPDVTHVMSSSKSNTEASPCMSEEAWIK